MEKWIRSWTASITPRKILFRLFEALLGVLFSNIILTRGIMPFGVAYAAVSSPFGFIGAFAGYLVSGRDTVRILTACFMTRIFRGALRSFSEFDRPLSCFLFTLWGTMLGGLVGFFTGDYTPAENLAFMLNGLISGGLAWTFSVTASAYSSRPAGNALLRYLCCTASLTALLLGVAQWGNVGLGTAKTALVFLLFCIESRCSYFYTVATGAAVCAVLCLFLPAQLPFFIFVFFGVLLSAAFRPLRRYAAPAACVVTAVTLWFLSGKDFALLPELMRLSAAGIGYLVLPGRWIARMTEAVVPAGSPLQARARKFHLSEGNLPRHPAENRVCAACPRRILCRTKDRTASKEALGVLQKQIAEESGAPSPAFFRRCVRFPELVAALKNGRKTVFTLKYATASAQKQGELFCGDTAAEFCTPEGKYVFTLTDGMGTGTAAARQSVKASRLMETLTGNGLSEEEVIKVINRALVTGSEETVVGVDVATVDLKNGVCETFKAGAAPTYVLRGGIAYEIGSQTLPVGILEEADIHRNRCTLLDGDFLILISDGVLGRDKKWLAEYLNRSVPPNDCVALADGILREAKRRGRNADDDVTVLTVQLNSVDRPAA